MFKNQFDHKNVEQKWQKIWDKTNAFKTTNDKNKKYYVLDMFPYPSASGLHVGHPEGYTASDIVARYKRLNDFDVLHPIGWDAFGLPAEQYALNTKNHPATFTNNNIELFKKQLKSLGFSYDWAKEINTTDPNYYKWTQWIFKELYKNNLAEIKKIDVNWCEELGTVLANEEVLTDSKGNKVSERGSFPVVKKPMFQWVLKITEYADRLIKDLDEVNYPESLKILQKNWIGKSNGYVVKFKIENLNEIIDVFTTRIDTIFGVTFLGLAHDHEFADKIKIKNSKFAKKIEQIKNSVNEKFQNTNQKNKDGFFTGYYAINPINNNRIPIYICDYVFKSYGTGAIMGVPSEDERDNDFAKLFNLKVIDIYKVNNGEKVLFNTINFDNLNQQEATEKVFIFLNKLNLAIKKISYKLRDWIFSRQRYWGEPFPVYFDENNNIYLEEKLVELPFIEDIEPSKTGESPLANKKDWLIFEKNGKKYRRETNTMPQSAGSSWYFLAYILKNDDGTYLELNSAEAFERFKKWMPVDLYIGGQEHAVGHLLYSRFWQKFLYDKKIVPHNEPFMKIVNQGMILGPDGQKMSKSRGNVINPDDIVEELGADTLRLYEMFMGPLVDTKEWSTKTIRSIRKWLDRVWVIITKFAKNAQLLDANFEDKEFISIWQNTIKDTTEAIEKLKFNIAISKFMVFINALYKVEKIPSLKPIEDFLIMLSTFAPHISEELLEIINSKQIKYHKWPKYNDELIILEKIQIPVQVNGKIRGFVEKEEKDTAEQLIQKAKNITNVQKHLKDKPIKKEHYVEDKIIILNN
ncbi:leucine--tRNA ligase [Mesomycoplasma neurolyticum]|uniref:Leucine--tRNA ligase n=1 Tax=Mesomycoplasma neurolyticum TaxID=2120 RepID=A0A449A5X4_9BACT|nr:leucine--tRNA ligase [Mesomycoplasma neurolyticum]VEU59638.1 Leucine--tRNA ligase [Mesomycoplasma neurolyticum]